MTYRVNPKKLTATLSGTGIANAMGPYNFRGGQSIRSVRISATSTNTTDVIAVGFTEPGVALATNSNESPKFTTLPTLTCPCSIVLDGQQIGGNVDIYVWATTNTGTLVANIEKVN